MAVTRSFDVEFDDALLDLEGWKNPRYDGSKLTGAKINKFTAGDITFGSNPVIESKIVALYVGNTLIGGNGEENAYTEITDHSYATIDKILLINLGDDSVELIDRQNTDPIAFKRFIDKDLSEGSGVNFKLLDFSVENALKPVHAVKFNRGSLQKIYAYTANTGGFEDGVFGGVGARTQSGQFLDNLSGSDETPYKGMFGYGSIFIDGTQGPISASLFNTNSIDFVANLPSELSRYSGDVMLFKNPPVNTLRLGSELNLITQSFNAESPTLPSFPGVVGDFDDGTTGGTGAGGSSGNAPSNKN